MTSWISPFLSGRILAAVAVLAFVGYLQGERQAAGSAPPDRLAQSESAASPELGTADESTAPADRDAASELGTPPASPEHQSRPDLDPLPPEALLPPAAADPTRPSPQLQRALEADALPPAAAGQQPAPTIPDVRLRARMVVDSVAEAILEIDGTYYRVSENDEIMIRSPRGGVVMVNVVELNTHSVRLQIPPLRGSLVLR